jgi:DNA-binding MarR family transcriptional regulator
VRRRSAQDDRRYSFIALTDKGHALVPEFLAISERLYKKARAGISEEEWRHLGRILEKLFANVN